MDIRIKKSIAIINHVIDELEFDNPKQFSDSLDFKRPERIYKILRGKTSISRNLANIIHKKYPQYSIEWLLTGEGEMLKEGQQNTDLPVAEPATAYEKMSVQQFHYDIKKDLAALAEGMTHNFEVVSDGIFETLKGQQKILKFIDDLDAKAISKATLKLNEMLKQTK